ncbi:MAG: hypothetical protein WBG71_05305 [Leeuwenhoekiella sp.]
MEIEALKKAIMKELENCTDGDLLWTVYLDLLGPPRTSMENKVKEEQGDYSIANYAQVPQEHYNLLEKDWEMFQRGELKTYSLKEIRVKMAKKLNELRD